MARDVCGVCGLTCAVAYPQTKVEAWSSWFLSGSGSRSRSTDCDEGEGGRLRRGVGVNRLGISRLSNAQGVGVRVGRLVSCRAEAQAEAQH